jgi:hypothetical protein
MHSFISVWLSQPPVACEADAGQPFSRLPSLDCCNYSPTTLQEVYLLHFSCTSAAKKLDQFSPAQHLRMPTWLKLLLQHASILLNLHFLTGNFAYLAMLLVQTRGTPPPAISTHLPALPSLPAALA